MQERGRKIFLKGLQVNIYWSVVLCVVEQRGAFNSRGLKFILEVKGWKILITSRCWQKAWWVKGQE